jgi:hypothetical protein
MGKKGIAGWAAVSDSFLGELEFKGEDFDFIPDCSHETFGHGQALCECAIRHINSILMQRLSKLEKIHIELPLGGTSYQAVKDPMKLAGTCKAYAICVMMVPEEKK